MALVKTLEMRRTLCRLLAERSLDDKVVRALVRLHVIVQRTGHSIFKIQHLKLEEHGFLN